MVSSENILEEADKHQVDMIGLSGLITLAWTKWFT